MIVSWNTTNRCKFNFSDVYNRLYFKYFVKTPWFNFDMIENISDIVEKVFNHNQMTMLQMMRLIAGRARAFFTEPQNINAVKQIFNILPHEELITPPPPNLEDALNMLLNSMNESRGKKVYFIVNARGYPKPTLWGGIAPSFFVFFQ